MFVSVNRALDIEHFVKNHVKDLVATDSIHLAPHHPDKSIAVTGRKAGYG
jgi:hypothetical protein